MWSKRSVGRGIRRVTERFFSLSLSQKINYTFAFFFFVAATQQLVDHRGFDNVFEVSGFIAMFIFILLAQFDNRFINFLLLGMLVVLSFILIIPNEDPSDLSAFILLSVGLAAAYKLSLFGRGTLRVLGAIVAITIILVFLAGILHGFTVWQRINLINFVVVYLALLFFIFEEETLSLRRQRDVLTQQASELRPFAELGTNTAGLVHDFKGDISGIYALSSIAKISGETELADKIYYYGERLNERVDSILYVATSGDHYEEETISLSEMLRRVTYYFIGINKGLKHHVPIELDVPDDVTITTRRNAMMVILENVIKNAVEATEGAADRTVRISAHENDDWVDIAITHRGKHLPWNTTIGTRIDVRRSNYFRRGRSSKRGGTGLGMINVIRALEILGAEMTMENLPTGVESVIRHPTCHQLP
jgi:signal transduction histidine kinase